MDNEQKKSQSPKTEICIIKVIFPTTSNEQSFDVKRSIENIVSGLTGVRVDFVIKTMYGTPSMPAMPAGYTPPLPEPL